jgi:hypothetical protein
LSSCSFSSPSVTPGAGTASSIVTISTTGHSAAMSRPTVFRPQRLYYAASFMGLLMPFGLLLLSGRCSPRRSRLSLILFVGLASLCFETSCSGGGSGGLVGTGGTPAGTYAIQVTGTAGSLSHSTTVSLTVQ